MNGQDRFYQFMIESVEEKYKDQASDLLLKAFQKQADGTFDMESMNQFMEEMLSFVKVEGREEVKRIMIDYRKNMKK